MEGVSQLLAAGVSFGFVALLFAARWSGLSVLRSYLLLCCSQPAGRAWFFFVCFLFCCCSQPAGQACFCFVCFRFIDIHSLLVRLVSPSEDLDLLFGEGVVFLHLHPPSPPLTSTLLHPLPCPPAYATSGFVTFRLLLCSSLVTIILFKLCPSSI